MILFVYLAGEGVDGQLVGSRGVIRLPAGFNYRDQQTVTASKKAARFARHFQPINDSAAEKNKKAESGRLKGDEKRRPPVFFTFQEKSRAIENEEGLFYDDFPSISLFDPSNKEIRTTLHQNLLSEPQQLSFDVDQSSEGDESMFYFMNPRPLMSLFNFS